MVRFVIGILIWMAIGQNVNAQVVDYTLPTGFENDLSNAEYKTIVDYSIKAVSARFKVDSVQDGTLRLIKMQDTQAFNLHNLIADCLAVKDHSRWEKIVNDHFTKLFTAIDAQEKIDPEDFKDIKKYLTIRIYPKEFLTRRPGWRSFVIQTNMEGTCSLLMLDIPGAGFTPVQRRNFTHWNRDINEIFDIAKANINKQPVQKINQAIGALIQSGDYASSYVLDLDRNSPELNGEWGTVVAIPNKSVAHVYKISKGKAIDLVKYIEHTKPTIDEEFNRHPQQISNQFFWYYKGKFVRINVTAEKSGKINVTPPAALMALTSKK